MLILSTYKIKIPSPTSICSNVQMEIDSAQKSLTEENLIQLLLTKEWARLRERTLPAEVEEVATDRSLATLSPERNV